MSIRTRNFADNTLIIDYNYNIDGFEFEEIFQAIHDFITTKGWEAIDPEPWSTVITYAYNHIRTYRALNKDGITYKYVQFRLFDSNTSGTNLGITRSIQTVCYEDYDVESRTGVAQCYRSGSAQYAQYIERAANHLGRLYIFASPRHLVLYNDGIYQGSRSGNGASGCVEILPVIPNDPTPNHFFFNSSLFAQGGAYPPRTIQTGENTGPTTHLSTPIGGWSSYGCGSLGSAVPIKGLQMGDRDLEHVYDINVAYDTYPGQYPKGKIFSLKAITTGAAGYDIVGGKGHLVKIKVDTDGFIDPDGIEKEHILFAHEHTGTVALPV